MEAKAGGASLADLADGGRCGQLVRQLGFGVGELMAIGGYLLAWWGMR